MMRNGKSSKYFKTLYFIITTFNNPEEQTPSENIAGEKKGENAGTQHFLLVFHHNVFYPFPNIHFFYFHFFFRRF